MDQYNEMLKGYDTDLRDDEISQITETILHEGLRENCNEEVYRFLFGCIDLTSLNPTDNQNQIAEFTRQVNELDNQNPELNHVAAICVYPNFVECVRMNLEVSDVNIAAVAGGFPSAQTFTEVKIAEAALAVAEGANEIDIVMNVGQFLSGEYEDICDEMEVDIANYLNKVSTEEPSADLKRAICGMLREVAEIESIGDSCHHIAHTARRNYRSTQQLTEKQLEHIHQMFQLTEQALEQMRTILSIRKAPREASTAYYIEREINKFRNQLRNLNFTDVNNGVYNYQTGAMYMDVINECEQLSDCILNVTEARLEAKES